MEDNFWTFLMIFEDFEILFKLLSVWTCGDEWLELLFVKSIHMIFAPPLTKYTHRLVDVYLPLRYHLLPFEKISNKETCYGNPARCCLFSGHVLGLAT